MGTQVVELDTGFFVLGQSGKAYVCGYNNYGSTNNPNGNYYT